MYDHNSRASDLEGAVPTPSRVPGATRHLGPGLEHRGVLTVLSAGLGDTPRVSRCPALNARCSVHAPAPRQCRRPVGEGPQRHGPGSAAHMHAGREVLAKRTETRARADSRGSRTPVCAGPAVRARRQPCPRRARRGWACPTALPVRPGPARCGRGGSGTQVPAAWRGLANASGFPQKARGAQPYGQSPRPEANPCRTQPKQVRGQEEARGASA